MEDLIKGESEEVIAALKEYFTVKEWIDLPEALKSRHLNTTRNYVDVPLGAVFFPMPDYMKTKKKLLDICTDVASDFEFAKPTSQAPKRKKINTESGRSNPKRSIPEKNYYEEEEPPEDRYVFCDVCEQEYLDFCSNCGMLVSLEDNPVLIGSEDRAKKTAPKGVLEVRPSKIHGFGVFAMRNLKLGIRLGPYEGETTRIDTKNGYAWKLRDGKLIDASDNKCSNYLRYVNCARNAKEQNLVGFQYKGGLYYRTCRKILKDEELLVFYGVTFAKNLRIDPKKYFEPVQEQVVDFYTCEFCHIGLSTAEYLKVHMKRCRFDPRRSGVYEGQLYKCEYCGCSLTDEDFLRRHRINCPYRKSILAKSENRSADRSNRNMKEFECEYCDYRSNYKYRLNEHVLAIHERGKAVWFECDQCEYRTFRKGDLRTHSRVHAQFRPFQCLQCPQGFNQKRSLNNHILSYHPQNAQIITGKIYSCGFCNYKTLKKTNLTRHEYNTHDKENTPKFHCSKCEYFSRQKSDLRTHLLRHSGESPYICKDCKKRFNQKVHLFAHILRKHNDNDQLLNSITFKIHDCPSCEYRTVKLTNFKNHLSTHSKESPFICKDCKKRFNQKVNLFAHILRKHNDNDQLLNSITFKIHNCSLCDYRTVNTAHLRKHSKTHK